VKVRIAAGATHQVACAGLVAAGLARHGITAERVAHVGEACGPGVDLVVTWGWRNGVRAQARGHTVLVMERAYLRDRFEWFSLGFDGLNGNARFPIVRDNGARWRQHFDGLLREPSRGGRYAVIMGQVPGDAALLHAYDLGAWYREAAAMVRTRYGLPVLYRPHPGVRALGRRPDLFGFKEAKGSLQDVLDGAAVVLAWNSNSLTDAALAGIPLVIGDHGAMTWGIGGTDTAQLAPREPWAHQLAYAQWLPREIESGDAWDALAPAMAPGAGFRFGHFRFPCDSVHSPALTES